jgi:nucleotide-binding universal stress UspA family protein
MNDVLLVPVDFTTASRTAVNHAASVAHTIGASIHLFHVVGKKSELEDAHMRLESFMSEMKAEFNDLAFNMTLRKGSIFEDIGEMAEELGAKLIIMGTHGMKGMQFIVGSNALRIVSSSITPIVIVQDRPIRPEGYEDIVVPLDLHKETKQKLALVAKMAKYFHSKVHLISPNENDEFLANTLKRNLTYASQMLQKAGVSYTVTVPETDEGDFAEVLLRFAASKDADLITIMNLREKSLAGILGGSYTQRIITNQAQIPTLLINPSETGDFNIFDLS